MNKNIKLFIFDMGGVVVNLNNYFDLMLEELKISKEFFINTMKNELKLNSAGIINSKKFWNKYSEKTKKDINSDLWKKYFNPKPNLKTLNIIKVLKNNNYRVVCGTNTIDSHYEIHEKNKDYKIFDKIYASHIIHFSKPDPNFFNYILNKEKILPEETIFIDDTQKNINVAKDLSINTILFKNAEDLKEKINAI